jgi:hypothetical protein
MEALETKQAGQGPAHDGAMVLEEQITIIHRRKSPTKIPASPAGGLTSGSDATRLGATLHG